MLAISVGNFTATSSQGLNLMGSVMGCNGSELFRNAQWGKGGDRRAVWRHYFFGIVFGTN